LKLVANELAQITAATLGHYESRAQEFWDGTHDHDVRQNVDALLNHIEASAPFVLLDFGCGPGRDLITFSRLGHRAIGLDGAAAFAEMARAKSGCEVWHQDFLKLDLPAQYFDGVFANASLQHVPAQELPQVLAALHTSLKPRGVLFASIPHGNDDEGWNAARYSCYHRPDSWRAFMTRASFEEVTHFYRPTGLPREEQRWFASVWRKQ
jgi:SAM-dependent methyltransferase